MPWRDSSVIFRSLTTFGKEASRFGDEFRRQMIGFISPVEGVLPAGITHCKHSQRFEPGIGERGYAARSEHLAQKCAPTPASVRMDNPPAVQRVVQPDQKRLAVERR